jgi:hypothetical protein
VPIVFKSGSLNLLELSGSVQTCNGVALPLSTCPTTDPSSYPSIHIPTCVTVLQFIHIYPSIQSPVKLPDNPLTRVLYLTVHQLTHNPFVRPRTHAHSVCPSVQMKTVQVTDSVKSPPVPLTHVQAGCCPISHINYQL